ncbi:MAG: DUF3598 family protein [Nostocaceae cyanobacterium]|nr:DUF3598 family protein [Nostocaceae cyanobacterium]
MKTQWESLLQNLGVWEGSFTIFSPQGELLEDIPSRLCLETLDDNKAARLTLQRQGKNDVVLNFSPQGIGGIMFFENGAFSQGPVQFSPYAQFGAEFCLIYENCRLRLVQLYDYSSARLKEITLIREHLTGTQPPQRPTLKVDDLLGEWQGEAVTIYPDLRPSFRFPTTLKLHLDNTGRLVQSLSFAGETITSSATVKGSIIHFDQNPQNQVQVLLLPDGSSATSPVKAQLGQSLFLESGWLIQPQLRQRIVRSYNGKGEFSSLTLITETKVG